MQVDNLEKNVNKYYSIDMDNIKANFFDTTKHIADKILMLRRACNLTQEEFAEKINVERRTVARAEGGKYRPSGETMEAIASVFKVPISYFYDNSVYDVEKSKAEIIDIIISKLNVLTKEKLNKINKIIDIV